MVPFLKRPDSKASFILSFQIMCLILLGFIAFFNIAIGSYFRIKMGEYLCLSVRAVILGFWLVTLWQSPRRLLHSLPWRSIFLGAVMVEWFLMVELIHRSTQMGGHPLSLFLCVYIIVLPFAAITRDEDRQLGIRAIAWIYIAAALVLMAFVLVLMVIYEYPGKLYLHVAWDGTRLDAFHHPNVTARIFMIAIGLSLGFFSQVKKRWKKGLLLAAAALFFLGMALTNSRAGILLGCVLLGGNVFFRIFRGERRRLLAAVTAAAVTVLVCFMASNAIYQWNSNRLIQHAAAQTVQPSAEEIPASSEVQDPQKPAQTEAQSAEPPLVSQNPQGSLLTDMFTFNNRILIWSGAMQRIIDDPMILLRGTDDTSIQATTYFTANHTHNAWLETLLRLGLPGFLLSLVFTWQALWSSLHMLWSNRTDLWKKNIAMLVLCLMATSMMEPFLFFTRESTHFFDLFFFLCLGYLLLWKKQLADKSAE